MISYEPFWQTLKNKNITTYTLINKHNIKEFFMIILGLAITTAGVYFFMLPSHVSVGSVSALAMVLSNFLPLPISVISFILNTVLLVLGFLMIGPEYIQAAVKTEKAVSQLRFIRSERITRLDESIRRAEEKAYQTSFAEVMTLVFMFSIL